MIERVQMSIEEAERLGVMRQIDKKILTIRQAGEDLGVSLRQAKRIRKRYLEQGAAGLISRKRGKASNRRIADKLRKKALELVAFKYSDFGPTLACEKLKERNKIAVSVETLRQWMIQAGRWTPKRKKQSRVYQRRTRRSRFGELLQGDGSPHAWFEDRGQKCTLLQFVDDATGKITVAKFMPAETTEGYLALLEEHLHKHGRPLALYVDKHSIFRVNREELKKSAGITHFGRVVKALDIELICAHSPQAKGRVERKNGVLQDRLIKEMRLRGINHMEEANAFLPQFLESINQKFGKAPASAEDAHKPLRVCDDLKQIFARKETRKLSKDLTFQHRGILYLIQTKTPNQLRHATITVLSKKNMPIEVEYKGQKLLYTKWSEAVYEQPQIVDCKEIAALGWTTKSIKKPGRHHPWR